MEKVEKIEDLYKGKFLQVPENIQSDLGHFNVFRVEPFSKTVPYRRRDYYKITLVIGNSRVMYADKVIDVRLTIPIKRLCSARPLILQIF